MYVGLRAVLLTSIALSLAVCDHKDDSIPVAPRDVDNVFGSVRQRWFQSQASWPTARPLVAGDVVIFGTGDQRLVARDRKTGAPRWTTRVTSVTQGQNVAVGGLDIVASAGAAVAALSRNVVGVDVATGTELWSYSPPPDTTANPQPGPGAVVASGLVADGDFVYVPAWGASVSALDIHTGASQWVWRPSPAPTFRSGAQGATLSGDTLFVNAWNALNAQFSRTEAWLVALDRRTGRELWRVAFPSYTLGTVVSGRPALWHNLVIVASAGGYVFAVDRTTRAIAWRYTPTSKHTSDAGPVVFGDVVYVDAGDDYVLAMRASDGGALWRTNMLNSTSSDFLVTPSRLYAVDGAFMNIIDRATGRFVARRMSPNASTAVGAAFTTPPAAAGNEIYVTVMGGAWSFQEP